MRDWQSRLTRIVEHLDREAWKARYTEAREVYGLPIVSDPTVPDGVAKIVHSDGRIQYLPFPWPPNR